MNGKGLPTGLRWSIILSALLHVAVATAVLVAGSVDSRSQKPPEKVITAKLLKLGKQRPEDLLPRLTKAH